MTKTKRRKKKIRNLVALIKTYYEKRIVEIPLQQVIMKILILYKEIIVRGICLNKGKSGVNILQDMPPECMQLVCHNLSLTDMCNLASTSKEMLKKVKEQEDIWALKVYKRWEIKMGYEYIRKENLIAIDLKMKPLQKKAMSTLLKGKWKQKLVIIIWFLFFFFMAFIIFPVLLILDEEGLDIPTALIFMPLSLSWIWLIIATLSLLYISSKVKKSIVNNLWEENSFKDLKKVKGRKFQHPKFWPFSHYLSKALFNQWLFLILLYLGIFVKTTIVEDIDYLTMVLISWIPTGGVIFFKQLYNILINIKAKHSNSKRIRPVLRKAVEDSWSGEVDFTSLRKIKQKHDNESITPPSFDPRDIRYKNVRYCWWFKKRRYYFAHGEEFKIKSDRWFDASLLHTIILPNLLVGGFIILCALRLDDVIKLNWFIITIPTWILILPIGILTILHGITSQNHNVTIVEKIAISTLVPIGFIASYILGLLKLEEYIDLDLSIVFIPNFVSVIAFYIYTRQLKTVKIVPKPETKEDEDGEIPIVNNQ